MPRSAPSRTSTRQSVAQAAKALPGVGPHHAQRLRSHRLARALGLILTAAFTFVASVAGAFYVDNMGRLGVIDIGDRFTPVPTPTNVDPDDPYAGREMNILVMGTDYRDEENAVIAGKGKNDGGMRSDTTFLIHISGDRSWIEVISFPRDALVAIPACETPGGGTSQAQRRAMFNSAFATGAGGLKDPEESLQLAALCTVNTVRALTGIDVQNFLIVKMTGVIGVVDALGGVEMCFDEPVSGSPKYSPGLNIAPGRQTLDGSMAIEFVRARKGEGMGLEDGSDLQRIARQQAFVDSLLNKIVASDVIGDSNKLYGMLQATMASMSADPQLADIRQDVGLAFSLRNLDTSRIVFTELPTTDYPADPNRLLFTEGAKSIWARIAAGDPPESIAGAPDPGPSSGTTDPGTTDPGTTDPGTTDPGTATPDPGTGTVAPVAPERLPGVCYDGWQPPAS